MIQIKKTILTLVALLAVTTGAWAQGPWTSGDCTVTLSNGTLTVSGNGAMADYDNLSDLPWINNSGDITSVVVESGVTSVGMSAFCSLENITSVTLPEGLTAINDMAFNGCNSLQSITLPEGLTAISSNAFSGCSSLQSITIPSTVTSIGSDAFYSCSDMTSVTLPEGLTAIGGTAFASCSSLTSITIPSTVTSIGNMAFLFCSVMSDVYIYAPSLTTYGNMAFQYNASGRKIHVLSDAVDTYKAGWPDYAADIVGDLQPLASGPEVAWDKATKTGTFTMPGGNVTLEPEYYPQATVADGGVTAADADARATTDDPLVKVDATKLTGAKKLMYFVSNSGTTAPAYDAEGWTDQLPTAEGFTQQGIVYVWYYPVGTDEGVDGATATYSDGDICLQSITARIAAAPTYAVTFAEGTDPNEWTADPNADVKKGQTVTVTYTGTKKVIGVKAEKKAAAPASNPLDNTTTAWSAGTFVVPAGGLTYSDAITVSGDVTLVLTDGETLTLNKGISLAEGATLTVEGNGTMNINGTDNSTASTVAGSTGTLILTSGTLTATGGNGGNIEQFTDDSHGGNGGDAINGSVIVSGGTLTARGGNGGSVGEYCENCSGGNGGDAISGTLTINGGSTSVNDGSNGSIGNFCGDCTAGTGGKAVAGTVTDNR